MQRSAKEIRIRPDFLKNKKVNVEIGAIENKEAPHTIYISVSFWTKPKGEITQKGSRLIRKDLEKKIRDAYRNACDDFLDEDSKVLLPNSSDNIFILKIPDNFYYNKKKNFINIEIHINTSNISSVDKYPLNNKKNTDLFDEALLFANRMISNSVFKGKESFIVTPKNKSKKKLQRQS
jgi:hypothetical protein